MIPKEKIKSFLITKTATRCLSSETLVEKIINFQNEDAKKAVKIFHEVELVDFGKFYVSQSKVRKRIANIERGIKIVELEQFLCTNENRLQYLQLKLAGMNEQLLYYKSKIR